MEVPQKIKIRDFPGGPVVKNPPANSGDMGSKLAWGGLQSPCTTITESKLQSPHATATETHMPRVRALQQRKPPQQETYTPRLESNPRLLQLGQACGKQ